MKKTIPFEIIEKNQTIYFDILRLAELERILGKSITDIVHSGEAGINFCLAGMQAGLKHHYFQEGPAFYAEKMGEYISRGGRLDDVAIPIIRAIMASGIFGKGAAEKTEKKIAEAEASEEKNEQSPPVQ